MAKKSKWISRVCLAAAGFGLTAALALAPRQGVYTAETDLFWDGKLRDSVNQIGQARQDGFYLVQRGNREYLVTRGYDRAYEAPVWRLEGEKLTLSAGARFGEGYGLLLN